MKGVNEQCMCMDLAKSREARDEGIRTGGGEILSSKILLNLNLFNRGQEEDPGSGTKSEGMWIVVPERVMEHRKGDQSL